MGKLTPFCITTDGYFTYAFSFAFDSSNYSSKEPTLLFLTQSYPGPGTLDRLRWRTLSSIHRSEIYLNPPSAPIPPPTALLPHETPLLTPKKRAIQTGIFTSPTPPPPVRTPEQTSIPPSSSPDTSTTIPSSGLGNSTTTGGTASFRFSCAASYAGKPSNVQISLNDAYTVILRVERRFNSTGNAAEVLGPFFTVRFTAGKGIQINKDETEYSSQRMESPLGPAAAWSAQLPVGHLFPLDYHAKTWSTAAASSKGTSLVPGKDEWVQLYSAASGAAKVAMATSVEGKLSTVPQVVWNTTYDPLAFSYNNGSIYTLAKAQETGCQVVIELPTTVLTTPERLSLTGTPNSSSVMAGGNACVTVVSPSTTSFKMAATGNDVFVVAIDKSQSPSYEDSRLASQVQPQLFLSTKVNGTTRYIMEYSVDAQQALWKTDELLSLVPIYNNLYEYWGPEPTPVNTIGQENNSSMDGNRGYTGINRNRPTGDQDIQGFFTGSSRQLVILEAKVNQQGRQYVSARAASVVVDGAFFSEYDDFMDYLNGLSRDGNGMASSSSMALIIGLSVLGVVLLVGLCLWRRRVRRCRAERRQKEARVAAGEGSKLNSFSRVKLVSSSREDSLATIAVSDGNVEHVPMEVMGVDQTMEPPAYTAQAMRDFHSPTAPSANNLHHHHHHNNSSQSTPSILPHFMEKALPRLPDNSSTQPKTSPEFVLTRNEKEGYHFIGTTVGHNGGSSSTIVDHVRIGARGDRSNSGARSSESDLCRDEIGMGQDSGGVERLRGDGFEQMVFSKHPRPTITTTMEPVSATMQVPKELVQEEKAGIESTVAPVLIVPIGTKDSSAYRDPPRVELLQRRISGERGGEVRNLVFLNRQTAAPSAPPAN